LPSFIYVFIIGKKKKRYTEKSSSFFLPRAIAGSLRSPDSLRVQQVEAGQSLRAISGNQFQRTVGWMVL